MIEKTISERDKLDKILREIIGEIGHKDTRKIQDEIKGLSKYRPLNNLYYVALASTYYQLGDYEEALRIIAGKENWMYPSKYAYEVLDLMIKCFEKLGDTRHSKYNTYLKYRLMDDKNNKSVTELESKFFELSEKFLNDCIDECEINDLIDFNAMNFRIIEAMILIAYCYKFDIKLNPEFNITTFINEFKLYESNISFLCEQLLNNNEPEKKIIIIADNSISKLNYEVMIKALNGIGYKIILVDEMINYDIDYEIDMDETVDISIGNAESFMEYELVHPIEVTINSELTRNNISNIVKSFAGKEKDEFNILLSTRSVFDSLTVTDDTSRVVQCLSPYKNDHIFNSISFGYIGKYTQYISKLYEVDYEKDITEVSELDFSIIIPARNSAETLKYTIETCLNQKNAESISYEVLISDNSTIGNMEIFDLVNTIDSPRLKYFRTPKNLPLNRSFEYAVSKSKGEFIIMIGSDDGMLPWGLEYLKKIVSDNPSEDVIGWHRVFFQWSNSRMDSNPGKLVIPKNYIRGEIEVTRVNTDYAIKDLFEYPEKLLYYFPTLYINSGFRRRYVQKVLEKTGKLWDGFTQDMYMSLVNLLINESLLIVDAPISIAGMSNGSLGAKSIVNHDTNNNFLELCEEMKSTAGYGLPVANSYRVESCGIDTSLLTAELFRLYEISDLKKTISKNINSIDWTMVVTNIYNKLNIQNHDFFIKVDILRQDAYSISQSLGEWFDENILKKSMSEVYVVNDSKVENYDYFKGFKNKSLHLDARDFNVTNIYEASQLVDKILNL